MLEVDTLRRLKGQAICEVYGVDLEVCPGNLWVISCVKEHCKRNLGLEIKLRAEKGKNWSDQELAQIGTKLRDALLAAERLGVAVTKLTLRNILVRERGEVILGTCEGAVPSDSASMRVSQVKLATILAQMALLKSQELTQREGEMLLASNLPLYPQTAAIISSLTGDHSAPAEVRFSSASLPAPAYIPAKRCKTCNRDFTSATFHPSQLRADYRRYPQYLDSVCSIVCLDNYIKYCETMQMGEMVCAACGGRYRAEAGQRDEMCSQRCRMQARERNY
jgi:hypothetical protein